MNLILLIVVTFLSLPVSATKSMDLNEFPWANKLKAENVKKINVCGNDEINLTKKSLKNNFLVGNKGYLLSGLIGYQNYWDTLDTENYTGAKDKLEKLFRETTLWEVTGKEIVSLGKPSKVDTIFTASIKDCMDNGKKSNYPGNSCHDRDKKMCCMEKFPGVRISWEIQGRKFVLGYAPDPSVRLRVAGEKKHRYCQVVTPILLK